MINILCVDDNENLLHLYQDELSDEGYKVVVANAGKEALRKFKKESPDVVVLDIRMPGMNGIEILNAILAKNKQALVILHTAYPQYRQNFMTWGAEAYVVKSSDLSEFKQTIRRVLDGRKEAPQSKIVGTPPYSEKRNGIMPLSL